MLARICSCSYSLRSDILRVTELIISPTKWPSGIRNPLEAFYLTLQGFYLKVQVVEV